MKIYFISGLGADERVFQYLNLPDIEKVFIKWEKPLKRESLSNYAGRLIKQIDISQPVYLIGVSFGGLIAQEIAKQINCVKIIIISSIKSPKEFSWALKCVKLLQLHLIYPKALLKWSNRITGNFYFSIQSKKEAQLLVQIINDTDLDFLVWAMHEIINWKPANETTIPLLHIHGTHDRIFPVGNLKDYLPIKNGGHFMIVNQSKTISEIILNYLNK
ncbi:MAG: alpha/beta hydrolase [Bacteroidota bacterium]